MLDLPPDSEGLRWIDMSNPEDLLLIPGLLPASITAAAMGDHQAEAYLRFTAQHFAGFSSHSADETDIICAAAALSSIEHDPEELSQLLETDGQERRIFCRRRQHTINTLVEAAEGGLLASLKWLRGLCQPSAEAEGRLMAAAAQEGHLEVLQYLRQGPKPAPWRSASLAALAHPECLKWLLSQEPPCPCHEAVLPALAGRGQLDMLKWIHAHPRVVHAGSRAPWNSAVTTAAAAEGQLPVLQWLRALPNPCPWNVTTAADAASGGHLDTLKWLHAQGCPWDDSTCARAAAKGDIGMLQWVRSQAPPCPWGPSAPEWAAYFGRMECLQWLQAHGCPWDTEVCRSAARHDLSMLKWLRAHNAPWSVHTSQEAARMGDLPKLKWLHAEGCKINGSAYLTAGLGARRSSAYKQVLRWLHETGIPAPNIIPHWHFSMPVMLFLAEKGFVLGDDQRKAVCRTMESFCTFHGLLRWFRRAVSDPSCGAHRAFDYFALSNTGQDLLARLSQLPPELITRIAVAAELQHDILS